MDGPTDLAQTLRAYVNTSRRPGYLILISDLLSTTDLEAALRVLIEREWQVVVMHLLSPWELSPRLDSDMELVDAETGETLRVRPNAETITRYGQRFGAWLPRSRDIAPATMCSTCASPPMSRSRT